MRTRKEKGGKPKGRGEKPKWGDKTQGVEKEKRAVDWRKAKSWNKTRKGATPKGAGKHKGMDKNPHDEEAKRNTDKANTGGKNQKRAPKTTVRLNTKEWTNSQNVDKQQNVRTTEREPGKNKRSGQPTREETNKTGSGGSHKGWEGRRRGGETAKKGVDEQKGWKPKGWVGGGRGGKPNMAEKMLEKSKRMRNTKPISENPMEVWGSSEGM